MIGEWQEAEPEIGQVAMVYSISRGNFLGICRLNRSGDKVWYDENSGREYDLDRVDEWAPITTPEERRLRNEVERLRDQLRWRKWPEELPKTDGEYLLVDLRGLSSVSYWETDDYDGEWIPQVDQITHWRPIGELPTTEAGGRIVSEKFGIPEMREFAMAHGDQRVYLIWLRLNEARTKNALWCSETVKLRAEVDRLEDILHEYFLAMAGYMHHATKRLADECNRINQKREAGGA